MFCAKCGAQIQDTAAFCYQCGTPNTNAILENTSKDLVITPPSSVETVPGTANQPTFEQTKEHLSHAKTIELNCYALEQGMDRLQSIINTLGHRREIPSPHSQVAPYKSYFWTTFFYMFFIGGLIAAFTCGDAKDSVIANFISIIFFVLVLFNEDLLIGLAVAVGIALVSAILVSIFSGIVYAIRLQRQKKIYERKVAIDQERVNRELATANVLRQQRSAMAIRLEECKQLRKRFYAQSFIKEQYRDMVAVTTMYEYYDTERCYTLVGPDGAYNLYSHEVQMGIIIASLKGILHKLDQIQMNQQMLYNALRDTNSYLDLMHQQALDMANTGRQIRDNSAVSARNAKIAAQNSEISLYLDICKF